MSPTKLTFCLCWLVCSTFTQIRSWYLSFAKHLLCSRSSSSGSTLQCSTVDGLDRTQFPFNTAGRSVQQVKLSKCPGQLGEKAGHYMKLLYSSDQWKRWITVKRLASTWNCCTILTSENVRLPWKGWPVHEIAVQFWQVKTLDYLEKLGLHFQQE